MYSLSPSSPRSFSGESHTSRSHPVVIPVPPVVIPASHRHTCASHRHSGASPRHSGLPSSFPPPLVIPAKAGIQGMDTGFRRYDEENLSPGTSRMESP